MYEHTCPYCGEDCDCEPGREEDFQWPTHCAHICEDEFEYLQNNMPDEFGD